jgi:hypothetical protein
VNVCTLDDCEEPARQKFCCREHQLKARAGASSVAAGSGASDVPSVHIMLPDTQVKPGVPNDHLVWAGRYIAEEFGGRPNVTIVQIGDHWDLPSLSSYDKKGGVKMEGRRYQADVGAGNHGFRLLDRPISAVEGWVPRKVFLFGNHENRIERAVESDAQLEGLMSLADCDTLDWERHDFLDVVEIDGVLYSHYFYNPMSGRPYSGENLSSG